MPLKRKQSQSLEQYIEKCFVSEDDPGVLFSWDCALDLFVRNANSLNNVPAQPLWISTPPGQMTVFTFQQDVINHLALLGGGSYGNVLVAPNNLNQFADVLERLSRIEMDGFIQAAMFGIPAGSFLASIAIVHDRRNVCGTPRARAAPPAPFRQIFI
jgi:hypothetical protein